MLKIYKVRNYVSVDGSDLSAIEKQLDLPYEAEAPVKKDSVAGRAVYLLNGKEIGSVNILYGETVDMATFKNYFLDMLEYFFVV